MKFKFFMMDFFKNFFIAMIFLAIEILIAKYIDDDFIRPYVGDIIVMFFIYFIFRCFIEQNMLLPAGVLIFAVMIEVGQKYNLCDKVINAIGSENEKINEILRIAIGNTFEIRDIICYIIGMIFIYLGIVVKNMIDEG